MGKFFGEKTVLDLFMRNGVVSGYHAYERQKTLIFLGTSLLAIVLCVAFIAMLQDESKAPNSR